MADFNAYVVGVEVEGDMDLSDLTGGLVLSHHASIRIYRDQLQEACLIATSHSTPSSVDLIRLGVEGAPVLSDRPVVDTLLSEL